jgi:putative ABC transport system permease protein
MRHEKSSRRAKKQRFSSTGILACVDLKVIFTGHKMSTLLHALRNFRRTPGFTAIALLSIAISVGATAVVFTAVKSVLIEPLPYSNPGELVQLRTEHSRFGPSHADWVLWPDMQDVIKATRTFESLGIYTYKLFNLSGDGNAPPEALYGSAVSANMFPTLGVKPMLGRNILPEEDQPGRDREMILSYGLWTRRFNSDRNILGRSVEINGHQCTIIGVMPRGFDFPMRLATTVRIPSQYMEFWAPLGADPAKMTRNSPVFAAVARLRKGVSAAQAGQDLAAIAGSLARQYPVTNGDRSLHLSMLTENTYGFARTGLLLTFGAALLFMLIGCANVANLLLARALARHREMAVRLALGAGRMRIAGQMIAESCVLAVAGGLGGYALAALAWTLLPAIAPVSIPRLAAARADWTVFAFTLLVSVLNGIFFGVAPALRSARRDPALALRESGSRGYVGGSRNRLRSALVVAEVAVAVMLVVIGGLLTGSFVRLLQADTGFQPDRILASIIIPSGDQYNTPESRAVLFHKVLDSVRTLPGVELAGTVDALPFSSENHGGEIGKGDPNQALIGEVNRVSADYLQTMGVRLLDGRFFREDDMDPARENVIVSAFAANRLWPGESGVGKRICVNCSLPQFKQWKQVIGVVSDARHASLAEPIRAQVYNASAALQRAQFLVVRTARPTAALAKSIREAVASVDPKQPVFLSASLSRLIDDSVADRRFIMTLMAVTGILALLLSAAGIYGVVSYATSLRTQEIGVRLALGATPRNVHAMVFRQGMTMAGFGVVLGLTGALVLTRALRTIIEGLTSTDPILIVIAVGVVTATAAVACLIPAVRATRVDPMTALRQD